MQKKIIMLLMAIIISTGITQAAFAENLEGLVFNADYSFGIDGNEGYSYDEYVTVIVSSDIISGEYITDHGDVVSWNVSSPYEGEENIYGSGKNIYFSNGEVKINGLLVYEGEGAVIDFNPFGERSFKFSAGGESYNGNSWYFSIGGDLATN